MPYTAAGKSPPLHYGEEMFVRRNVLAGKRAQSTVNSDGTEERWLLTSIYCIYVYSTIIIISSSTEGSRHK